MNRQEIVDAALSFVGTPFRHMGRIPGKALDCVGVAIKSWEAAGVEFPEPDVYAAMPAPDALLAYLPKVAKMTTDPKPGDFVVIVMRGAPCHIGVLDFEGNVIHSAVYLRRVTIEPLSARLQVHSYWRPL